MIDARPAVIEIVERRKKPSRDSLGASCIVPTDVRINGQSVACSSSEPITVHEIAVSENDLVKVTLTLLAKRVFIGHEDIDAELAGVDAARKELLDAQRAAADSARAAAERIVAAQQALSAVQGDIARRLNGEDAEVSE